MRRPRSDAAVVAALRPLAWVAVLCPVLVVAFVLSQAAPALVATRGVGLVTDADWSPTSGRFNLLPMLAGTVVVSALALGLAGPLAIAHALHVNHFAGPRFAALARATTGTLAGVPSVIFGFVTLVSVVPLLVADHPPGLGLGVTTLMLAVMILPTAAAACDAAVQQVGGDGIRAVHALGLGRWDAIRAVVLPLAAPGLRLGLVLAACRAVGETMAVLMVAGNTVQWPTGPFTPFRTLSANIAVEMAYAQGVHRSALFASAVLLLAVVGLLILPRRRAARA